MKQLDWNHIRAFHATATTGSLSKAARRLALTQPTLSRQVAALEQRLGIVLFERVGRRLALTETGRDLLAHVEAMGEAADGVSRAASGRAQAIAGPVSLSVTEAYAAYVLPPIVERIRARAPGIALTIVATDALSDLHRREADIAVRHQAPARAGLVGRQLRDTQARLYASQAFLARRGPLASPADLTSADMIGFDDPERFAGFLRGIGIAVEARDFRLVSDRSVVVWEMARCGLGVAAMLVEIGDRTQGMVRLFPDMAPIPVPVWLVTHRELATSPRIRIVHEILAEELAES